jgi:hypothetical protein
MMSALPPQADINLSPSNVSSGSQQTWLFYFDVFSSLKADDTQHDTHSVFWGICRPPAPQ